MKGKNAWVWIVLVAAAVGVLYAKNAGRQRSAPASAIPTGSQPVVADSTGAAVAATESAAAPASTPGLPRLVDLGAGKCIPCKLMAPILVDLKQSYTGRLEVTFIDVWEKPEAAKTYGINIIPTQIFYDSEGKELFRHEGFFGKEDILAKWKEFGVVLN